MSNCNLQPNGMHTETMKKLQHYFVTEKKALNF